MSRLKNLSPKFDIKKITKKETFDKLIIFIEKIYKLFN